MQSVGKYICCGCCHQEEQPVPAPVEIKPTREDRYLDSDNPVQAILESPEIESLTLASINIFLEDEKEVDTQYTTVSHEEAARFRKAVLDSKAQNPEICTTMMRDLLNLLPKKGKKSGSKITELTTKVSNISKEGTTKKKRSQTRNKRKKSNQVEPFAQKAARQKMPGEISLQSLNIQDKGQDSIIKNSPNRKMLPKIQPKQSLQEQEEDSGDQQQFKQGLNTLLQQNSNDYIKIVKTFIYLYTSPYIYKDLNKRLTESRYDNYTKIVGFVADAMNKLPINKKYEFKLNFTSQFSLYRGIKSKNSFKEDRGYWKAFTSCSLKKKIAEEFADKQGGTLIEILLKPPVSHMYLKVPKDPKFTFYEEEEIILFPFFHYEVLQRIQNRVKVRQVRRAEVTFGQQMPR